MKVDKDLESKLYSRFSANIEMYWSKLGILITFSKLEDIIMVEMKGIFHSHNLMLEMYKNQYLL